MNKYTQQTIDYITQTYKTNPSLETVRKLSNELNIPERSIITKLSILGVYQRKQYQTKQGTSPVRKEYYLQELSRLLDLDLQLLESLEKANKTTLRLMCERIQSK